MRSLFIVSLGALLLAGCGAEKQSEKTAAPARITEAAPAIPLTIMDQARECYFKGDKEGALKLIEKGLTDASITEEHPMLFRSMLELLITMDRLEEAQTRFLGMIGVSEPAVSVSYGMIEARLQDEPEALQAWLEQLQAQPKLPASLQDRVFGDRIWTLARMDKLPVVIALVPEAAQRFGAGSLVRLFSRPFGVMLEKNAVEPAQALLAAVESGAGDSAEARDFILTGRLSILADTGKWEELKTRFAADACNLADGSLRAALRRAADKARAGAQLALEEALARQVLTACSERPASRQTAVEILVKAAETAGGGDAAVKCMVELKGAGATAADLQREINRAFYDIMKSTDAATKEQALQLVEFVLSSVDQSGASREQFQALLMDGAVLSDDYKRALAVLDSGFRADDKDWHDMAVNKVKAHLALQEGRTEEAVQRFRTFMEHVATWTEATTDPSTGMRHTREMSLGFNAKRIADILTGNSQTAEAAKMLAEARQHYEAALKEFQATDKEYTYIEEQLKTLP